MSLVKSVPEGLIPQECKRTKLRKPPPVPYISKKDKVQDKVAKLRNCPKPFTRVEEHCRMLRVGASYQNMDKSELCF
jgi:hypothetical protein